MTHTAAYVAALDREFKSGKALEHAYRPALKNYLEALIPGLHAINDPKRQKCGAPDYVVSRTRKGQAIDIGYIEAKDVNVGLDKIEKSDQMKRYLASLDNLILTDYLEFRFYRNQQKVATVRIAEVHDFFTHTPEIKSFPEQFGSLETLLAEFAEYTGQTIKSPKQLAEMMARKARLMRDVFAEAVKQDDADNTLREQWQAFRQILIHDMDEAQFADVYAQTITYGLFTARLHDQTLENFSREEARGLIPRSNPFVRQLFDYVCGASLDHRVVWIVDALCEVYRAADVHSILKSFGRATGRNDPIVHFYEDFLGQYDSKLRKARGVWYTPEPVVNFIVRAVDEVLKTHFHLPDGLADTSKVTIEVDDHHITKKGVSKKKIDVHRVQLLDVAAGTGTFTAEAIKQIYARFAGQEGMWSSYVEEHLLPRLHGFEILMASYAMCHLKIDMLLAETGYKPKNPNNPPRLGVYLTNALEEHHPDVGTLFAGWLAKEANEASRIKKDVPIMVAYGNPPYSGQSSNKGEWIGELINDYKKEYTGEKLNERMYKWLQDDYVKFIRLAEHYIERNGEGVLAFITNHGYLDNPTFRGMRWHLLNTFDDIYVLDLHGNAKKKEVAPDGSIDKNVFDIQQGVAIIIAIKHSQKKKKPARVYHAELWGRRDAKYDVLWSNNLSKINWSSVNTNAPAFLFIPKDAEAEKAYNEHISLKDLFDPNGTPAPGIVTTQDEFAISWTREDAAKKIEHFLAAENEDEARKLFRLCSQDQWNYEKAKAELSKNNWREQIVEISYRPFDTRYTVYNQHVAVHRRERMTKHFILGNNIGLVTARSNKNPEADHFFISKYLTETKLGESSTQSVTFPLYLYPDTSVNQTDLIYAENAKRKPNLDEKIVVAIAKKLKLPFVSDHEDKNAGDHACFSPLDLLDYIYAVLHSPTYRRTYKEFLKIDFPRIPYPQDAATFWKLAALGGELRTLHLLEHPTLATPRTTYPVAGDNMVEKPAFVMPAQAGIQPDGPLDSRLRGNDKEGAAGRVYINKEQYFGHVPEVAWNFYIGGYQPAQKWLKDRKGRTLTTDDLRHYQKIIIALTETDRLMHAIDATWTP